MPILPFISAIAKAVGALLGGILALAFLPPKNMRDFITRSVFSLIAGFVFADPVRLWLKWEADMSMHIAAGALTALCSWWVFGSILKVIAAWKPK